MYDGLRDLLGGDASGTLAGLLVGGAAKAFLVLFMACLVSIAMRRASAARRHLAWSLAIAVVLVLPLGSSVLPRIQIAIPGLAPQAAGPSPVFAETAGAAALAGKGALRSVGAPRSVEAARGDVPDRRVLGRGSARASTESAVAPARTAAGAMTTSPSTSAIRPDAATVAVPPRVRSIDGSKALLSIWLLGVALSLGRLLISGARIRWLETRAETIDSGPLYRTMRALARQVGLSQPPILLRGDDRAVPMTWGVRRSRIILPAGAEAWASWRIEAVLLHELGHIARRDYLAQLAATVMCSLHWFNPLAWLASRRMHVERELACDDLVLSWGHEPSSYARDLLELAKALRTIPLAASAAVCLARPNRLRDRLVALMDETRDRRPVARGTVGRAALIALTVGLPVAALAPVPDAIANSRSEAADPAGEVSRTVDEPATARWTPDTPADEAAAPDGVETRTDDGGSWTVPVNLSLETVLAQLTPAGRRPINALEIAHVTIRAGSEGPQQATSLCGPGDGGSRNHSSQISDDVITIEMAYGDCRSSVRIEGDIEFNEDFTSVERLSSRSFLRLEVLRGGEQRRIEVRPSSGGRPEFEWSVDGRERPFDAAAQQWFAGALLDLFRTSSYKATERAIWILGRSGVDGVLDEVRRMWAGHVQARYLTVLLEEGELEQSQIRRVLAVAGQEIESDHSLGTVLGAAAETYAFDATTTGAFIEAAATLESDHQHARVLGIALGRGDLSQENLEALLESATVGLESDHQMAGILIGLAERYPLDRGLRGPFLQAAATLDSDQQKGQVYGVILGQEGLAAAELAAVLDAASTMGSDHNLAMLLIQASEHDLGDPALRTAFLRAASSIESDHSRSQVLSQALGLGDLTDGDLADILSSASTIGSDHLLGSLLQEVAEREPSGRATRQAFLVTAASIDSDHNLSQTLAAFARLDLGPADLVQLLDTAAEGVGGDHLMTEFLLAVAGRHTIEGQVRDAFMRALDTIGSRRERVASSVDGR